MYDEKTQNIIYFLRILLNPLCSVPMGIERREKIIPTS